MSLFQDAKRQARRSLHATMKRAVVCVPANGSTPVSTFARLHYKFDSVGSLESSRDVASWAEAQEQIPKLVFMLSEYVPKKNTVVSFAPGDAYRIDNVLPADDITQTAEAVRLSVAETHGLPVPENP